MLTELDNVLADTYNVLTMKIISLRDFQLKPTDYILEPVTLTRYKKPILVVLPMEYYEALGGKTPGEGQIKIREVSKTQGVLTDENREVEELAVSVPSMVMGYCQGPLYEKGVVQPTRRINYEDENGTALIKEKYFCEKCIKMYQDKGVGRVYFI